MMDHIYNWDICIKKGVYRIYKKQIKTSFSLDKLNNDELATELLRE